MYSADLLVDVHELGRQLRLPVDRQLGVDSTVRPRRVGVQHAQVPSVKEPIGLIPASDLQPDGASMLPWTQGRCLAWDVTAPDTLAQSHVQATATNAGAAASKAETSKMTKYAALSATHLFIPLAFETLGSWGEQAKSFTVELGKRVTAITGDVRETDF